MTRRPVAQPVAQPVRDPCDVPTVDRRLRNVSKGISQLRLAEAVSYDQLTGLFVWIDRKKYTFGRIAGNVGVQGYVEIRIDRVLDKAHRLAWLYVHGKLPSMFIDHIDGNRRNNAISNLRECNGAQNIWNSVKRPNQCGLTGVKYSENKEKFYASVQVGDRYIHLGTFLTAREAGLAYQRFCVAHRGEFAVRSLRDFPQASESYRLLIQPAESEAA